MEETTIDKYYKETKELIEFLQEQGEISYKNEIENNFKKSLILSCASFFEKEISTILIDFVSKATNNNPLVINFLKNKAIDRQYHTFFDFKGNNMYPFFGFFGKEVKDLVKKELKSREELSESHKALVQITSERNFLVHENFVKASTNLTTDETYKLYQKAVKFLEFIRKELFDSINKTP